MARDFGKIYVKIWQDPDFIALPPTAQRMYMFLLSQPDLNRAGVLTVALNRWASRAAGYSVQSALGDLATLARERFILVDPTCEELLVRSYIRIDEGWRSPNIMISTRDAATQVMSETLRAVIRDELSRLDTSDLSERINEKTKRSTRSFVESVIEGAKKDLANCQKDPAVIAWNPLANPSGNPLANPSLDQGVTLAEKPLPEPLPKPLPEGSLTTTTTTTATATTTATTTATYTPDFETFYAAYPRKAKKADAAKAFKQAVKSKPANEIIEAARKLANDPNLPEKQFIPYPATWLRADGWDDDPYPPRHSGGYRNSNQIMLDELERAHRATEAAPAHHQIEGGF